MVLIMYLSIFFYNCAAIFDFRSTKNGQNTLGCVNWTLIHALQYNSNRTVSSRCCCISGTPYECVTSGNLFDTLNFCHTTVCYNNLPSAQKFVDENTIKKTWNFGCKSEFVLKIICELTRQNNILQRLDEDLSLWITYTPTPGWVSRSSFYRVSSNPVSFRDCITSRY